MNQLGDSRLDTVIDVTECLRLRASYWSPLRWNRGSGVCMRERDTVGNYGASVVPINKPADIIFHFDNYYSARC